MPLLELTDVHARYGQVRAVHGISLTVNEGEVVALLGANGAGKTTTLRAISGVVTREGTLLFEGKPLPRRAEGTARRGITHVPEGRGILAELSVWENLKMGAYLRRDRKAIAQDLDEVTGDLPWLRDRRDQQAGTLSGGEQQMLALARARLSRPRLLLLDEPSLGLAPQLVGVVFDVLAQIRERGVTVLLVEQRAQRTVAFADRTYVLSNGELVTTFMPSDADDTERLIAAYFGS
jgi:branched-chain amino acid transport system ATP-binding protein